MCAESLYQVVYPLDHMAEWELRHTTAAQPQERVLYR